MAMPWVAFLVVWILHEGAWAQSSGSCLIGGSPIVPLFSQPLPRLPVLPTQSSYIVTMQQFAHSFHPSLPATQLWGYNAQYPGPPFEVNVSSAIRVTFVNMLPSTQPFPTLPDPRVGRTLCFVLRVSVRCVQWCFGVCLSGLVQLERTHGPWCICTAVSTVRTVTVFPPTGGYRARTTPTPTSISRRRRRCSIMTMRLLAPSTQGALTHWPYSCDEASC